jgi:glycosyltransferase involved in cell wall biosynthesis
MNINIIDPGLKNQTGHHFDWCLKIAKYFYITYGKNIKIFVSKNTNAETQQVLQQFGEVIPLFAENPYQYAKTVDPLCGDLTLYFDRSMMLASALKTIDQNAIWIWPTLFEYQLNALSLAKIKCQISACIHTAPEYRSGLAASMWRDAAMRASSAKINIHYGVTFSELAPLFKFLLRQEIVTLPLLVDAVPAQTPKLKLKRIGFFGDQSNRKGLHLLPELIKRLNYFGYEITVQDSKGKINGEQSQQLTILGYVEDIAQEMSKCDLIVLPYDPDTYKHMASAIAWEAIARGLPVVAPAGTVPGHFVLKHNAGVTFQSFTADSIMDAIARLNLNFETVATGAFNASQHWAAQHGSDKFVNAMLSSIDK